MDRRFTHRRRGGVIWHTLLTLTLMLVGFVLGYFIGKQRALKQSDPTTTMSLEEILKRELRQQDDATSKDELTLVDRNAKANSEETAAKSQEIHYTIQMGSFKRQAAAQQLQRDLEKKAIKSQLQKVDLAAKGVWWRVYVGKFTSEKEARAEVLRLSKKSGKSGLVTKLD